MKGFKGFDKGLVCRGKKYKENTVFEEEAAEICKSGMHFCENPFDVLDYYDLVNTDGSFNEFAEVEALDECLTDDNKKYCTKKLKIGAKLSFSGFVNACVEFILEKTKIEQTEEDETVIGSSGYYAQIGSSGYYAKIGSSGDSAKITSEGEDSVICCAGHNSIVKAKKGSWITLSEWEKSFEKDRWIPKCVKTKFVDGEIIKADKFYRLENGKFVEVKEDK
jgi:hypothetical protein